MWKAIQKYVEAFAKQYWDGTLSQQAMQRQREILANNIIGIRRELKDIWYGVFQWDVSTEVRSVEYEIVYRLIRESNGCTIPPGETKKIDDLIKFMRHDKVVRPLFAGAVGKRFMSERIISRGRTSLVEHHRAVKWAESSFQMLKEIRPMVMFRQNQDNVLAQRRDEVEETRALLETHRQELDQVHLRIEGAKRDLKRVQSELEIEKRRLLVGHLNFE